MPRYPKQPLEEKLAWMRERQRAKEEEARRKEEDELMTRLMQLSVAKADQVREWMRLNEEQRDRKLAELRPPKYTASCGPGRPRMLRVDEVAVILSVSVSTVQRWFKDRAVIVHPGPRKTTMLISQQALDDWFAEHQPPKKKSG